MYYELSKSEKKIARRIMDKGIDNHYHRALSDVKTIIQNWEAGKIPSNHDAYMKLYQKVKKNDTNIGKIYNDKGGSRWVEVISLQLADGVITVEDLSEFDEKLQNTILVLGGFMELQE